MRVMLRLVPERMGISLFLFGLLLSGCGGESSKIVPDMVSTDMSVVPADMTCLGPISCPAPDQYWDQTTCQCLVVPDLAGTD